MPFFIRRSRRRSLPVLKVNDSGNDESKKGVVYRYEATLMYVEEFVPAYSWYVPQFAVLPQESLCRIPEAPLTYPNGHMTQQ